MAKKKFYCFILIFGLFFSCQKDIEKKEAYRKGSLTIGIDPSFFNLGIALADVFKASYPDAKINFKTEVEDLAIADFIQGKLTMVMVSRDLSEEENKILFTKTKMKHTATQIACDATVFIVSKDSSIDSILISDLKSSIISYNNKYIFDGGNSSNFNNVVRKLKLDIDKNNKIQALSSPDEVINFIGKNKSHIGIIGLDALSDIGDPKVKEYFKNIKILPVVNSENKIVLPTISNLRTGIYPFTKRIYLLNAENNFLIGSSFSRFTGSQRGQLIVSRAGLQPYYLYERRVQIQ